MHHTPTSRSGEYKERGDYHRVLDTRWPYYPVYVEKMRFVERFLRERGRGKKILDVGCGEGILVERFRAEGYDISGLDKHYESAHVRKGDIIASGITDGHVDAILCLDMLEHLSYAEQEQAIAEMHRILAPGGTLLVTVPNLAHIASRVSFLFLGKLLRTSDVSRHVGDRPIGEYLGLLGPFFDIEKRKGFFPTLPFISVLTLAMPSRVVWLHRLYNALIGYPNWCFLNAIIAQKK